MYVIALCDDETKELDKTEKMLEIYCNRQSGCDFQIERFQEAEELLWRITEGEYVPDLLLMDIFMQGRTGIEVARELRKMGHTCSIVFLTMSREFALEAFRVDADQYLVKPVSEQELFPVLDRWMEDMEMKKKKYLILKTDGKIRRISLQEIIYFEAQKRKQCLYLGDGTQLLLSLTMAKIYEMLSEHSEFTKVGASYIINLDHVESLNARELQMDNRKKIYLPRGAYQPLKEQYFDYYCG